MEKYAYTRAADPSYVESLYELYQREPERLDSSWQSFFAAYEFFLLQEKEAAPLSSKPEERTKELSIHHLIQAYRSRGHLIATTNPVRKRRDRKPRLSLHDFQISDQSLSSTFSVRELSQNGKPKSLKEILSLLQQVYTQNIGFEYMHIHSPEIIEWFKNKCEQVYPHFKPPKPQKIRILEKLNEAVCFERFLHTKYVGQKRFSLEGGESTIPALDTAISQGAAQQVECIILGMSHRGRLNVLANVLDKSYEQVLQEFEGKSSPELSMGDGDVKYHMGYANVLQTPEGQSVLVKLAPNPSHLEAVDAVVQGMSRAIVDRKYKSFQKVLPILIHGDAALAGQGLVYEIAQMSRLEAHSTGGTIHFVINNQVGFTTDFDQARSSIYSTDVAKVIDAPILHVNGDDPEAVVFCMQLAVEFRQLFQRDIFVDMVCYRKHGHNESDEPRFTQPELYEIISRHPSVREVYVNQLIQEKQIDAQVADQMEQAFRSQLQESLNRVKKSPQASYSLPQMENPWAGLRRSKPEDFDHQPKTAISRQSFDQVAHSLTALPEGFQPLRQIEKLLEQRSRMFFTDQQLNWAAAELLAYGSMLLDSQSIRIVGQDTQRGTFSHRHAVLRDLKTYRSHSSLAALVQAGHRFDIYNSLLSEFGVLGFELGYSWDHPDTLVVWEAQFGDFANGAQVVIDQFVSTSYTKWQMMSGLVLLLPHGYEGQGPEHSSARLERFLQLCSGNNMFVSNITLPANFFHLLRRQLSLPFRMPCVVMSPKSLFRHSKVLSPIKDFTSGAFLPLIDDQEVEPSAVRKLLICSGKVYYDLLDAREASKRNDVAILRLEQLHPLPHQALQKALSRYKKVSTYDWVQEEPQNMGAWSYIQRVLPDLPLRLISRKSAASPATGYRGTHLEEQAALIKDAMS